MSEEKGLVRMEMTPDAAREFVRALIRAEAVVYNSRSPFATPTGEWLRWGIGRLAEYVEETQ